MSTLSAAASGGLELLVGGADERQELAQIRVDDITPNARQPRRRFEPEATAGLAESIRRQGLLQPVVVRPRPDGGYELIAGERRWRAAREAGIEEVPALVREADDRDSLLLALVENVAREQLSAVEEARAYAALLDEFGLSLGELAERVGRSKPSVSNRLRLLELPDEVLWMLARGELTEGHARAVLAVPDERRAGAAREAHRARRPVGSCGGARCSGCRREAQAPPRGRAGRSGARLARRDGRDARDGHGGEGDERPARDPVRGRDRARRARRGARAPRAELVDDLDPDGRGEHAGRLDDVRPRHANAAQLLGIADRRQVAAAQLRVDERRLRRGSRSRASSRRTPRDSNRAS